jgi:hypothetical protein
MTNQTDPLDEILQVFVTNIEHDGSFIPASAIMGKIPEAKAAINAEIAKAEIKLLNEIKAHGAIFTDESELIAWVEAELTKRRQG